MNVKNNDKMIRGKKKIEKVIIEKKRGKDW